MTIPWTFWCLQYLYSSTVYGILKPPTLHATRYLVGHGHQKGGIVTKVYNNDPKTPLNIVYMDVIPWFLRVFLHTLNIVDGVTR